MRRPCLASATAVECSRSHGDLSPVSAAMAMKAASIRARPSIQICGNGSALDRLLPDPRLVQLGEEVVEVPRGEIGEPCGS